MNLIYFSEKKSNSGFFEKISELESYALFWKGRIFF